jgi:predicted RNase H-like HicB family nuclease
MKQTPLNKFSVIIRKGDKYFIGQIREIPGVITQGKTIKETRENLLDALKLYSESINE